MRYILSLIFVLTSFVGFAEVDVNSALDELDGIIKDRYIYKVEKDKRIGALKFSLSNASSAVKRFDFARDLFNEYKSYQYDSAYHYALRSYEYAERSGRRDYVAQSQCNLLFCYSTVGLFKEGAEVIAEFSTEALSQGEIANFYAGCSHYYQNLRLYVGSSEKLASKYLEKQLYYTSLALENLEPESFQYRFIEEQDRVSLGSDYHKSVEQIERLLHTPNISLHTSAIMYSWLGACYEMVGEKRRAIYYTALSAIADIESCTYETTAAKVLARYMYEQGDISRANRYIRLALDDANIYNSSFRKLEIQSIMPFIEEERYSKANRDRNLLCVVIVLFVLMLGVIISVFMRLKKINDSLRRARAEIEERAHELSSINEQLSRVNDELAETNRIKDLYIIESLYGDSAFVDKVESMSKVLSRKIKAKQYSDIDETLSGLGIKKERARMSSAFDSAFLKLFPNFIAEYNKLFDAENAIELGEGGALSPEVRIFALVRLGIDDIAQMSKYLNLSPNTIYVYKAKVKAKTIVPKEEFEERIKLIN